METLDHLFENNRAWSEGIREVKPEFFLELSRQQSPKYLWIGCSDSRVPANQIVGLAPGELFVHRNIANLVVHTDLNCLSVMQFAVDILRVRPLLSAGIRVQRGGGGVAARSVGLKRQLAAAVQDVRQKHERLWRACLTPRQWTALRAERHREGDECLLHDHCHRRRGSVVRNCGARVDLWTAWRTFARPECYQVLDPANNSERERKIPGARRRENPKSQPQIPSKYKSQIRKNGEAAPRLWTFSPLPGWDFLGFGFWIWDSHAAVAKVSSKCATSICLGERASLISKHERYLCSIDQLRHGRATWGSVCRGSAEGFIGSDWETRAGYPGLAEGSMR